MITLVTGDFHLNDHPRDTYRHRAMKTIRDIAQEYKVGRTIILGDLTDEKDRHGSHLVNTIVSHLGLLGRLCEVVVLRGNHDYLEQDAPFFAFLDKLPHLRWINRPTAEGDELFLPHTRDHAKEWSTLRLSGYDWVFAHNTFAGARVGKMELDGIPLESLGVHVNVISGDIHSPQTLTLSRTDTKVIYVGAPYTINFGDEYDPRVLIINGNKLQSVPVPGPQKRVIDVHGNKLPKVKLTHGDILCVRAHLDSKTKAGWSKFREELSEWARQQGVYLQQIKPIVDRTFKLPAARKTDTRSDETLLKDYVRQHKADSDTEKAGLNIMRKA